MKPLAKIIVKETAGIRRFLYPLAYTIQPGTLQPPEDGIAWRVSEKSGELIPSVCRQFGPLAMWNSLRPGASSPAHTLDFAISLAPYEERELLLVETNEAPTIPDAMRLMLAENEGLTSQQERVRFHIEAKAGLDSVVYDGVEHLAGALSISLDGASLEEPRKLSGPDEDNPGLDAILGIDRSSTSTYYRLTACKSWIKVTYVCQGDVSGKSLLFSLPLCAEDETPTCDFGVGDGVYEKIGGDAVVWTTEFVEERPYAKWRVSTVNAGVERIDYQGEYEFIEDFAGRAWFHFMEKTKALAVAIPRIHHACDRMTVTLARNGKIDIVFTMSQSAPSGADFTVCYHFLNDIPAIAAATNPASILLPPQVKIVPLA